MQIHRFLAGSRMTTWTRTTGRILLMTDRDRSLGRVRSRAEEMSQVTNCFFCSGVISLQISCKTPPKSPNLRHFISSGEKRSPDRDIISIAHSPRVSRQTSRLKHHIGPTRVASRCLSTRNTYLLMDGWMDGWPSRVPPRRRRQTNSRLVSRADFLPPSWPTGTRNQQRISSVPHP